RLLGQPRRRRKLPALLQHRLHRPPGSPGTRRRRNRPGLASRGTLGRLKPSGLSGGRLGHRYLLLRASKPNSKHHGQNSPPQTGNRQDTPTAPLGVGSNQPKKLKKSSPTRQDRPMNAAVAL